MYIAPSLSPEEGQALFPNFINVPFPNTTTESSTQTERQNETIKLCWPSHLKASVVKGEYTLNT